MCSCQYYSTNRNKVLNITSIILDVENLSLSLALHGREIFLFSYQNLSLTYQFSKMRKQSYIIWHNQEYKTLYGLIVEFNRS